MARPHMSYLLTNHPLCTAIDAKTRFSSLPAISLREMQQGVMSIQDCQQIAVYIFSIVRSVA
jgi:hypothetical protein